LEQRLFEAIDRLVHQQGYTLKGALKALREGEGGALAPMPVAAAPVAAAIAEAPAPAAPSFAFRARLIALRTTLVNALHEG